MVGIVWMFWFIDVVGFLVVGFFIIYSWGQVGFYVYSDFVFLFCLLNMFFYFQEIFEIDVYGNVYEFDFDFSGNLFGGVGIMGICGLGCEGMVDGMIYILGLFFVIDYDQDIVWVDGYFVCYLSGLVVVNGVFGF